MLFVVLALLLAFDALGLRVTPERVPSNTVTEWPQWSGDIRNHHNLTPTRPVLGPANVHQLRVQWRHPVPNSVVATPTLKDGTLYFTDIAGLSLEGLFTGGRLHAVDARSGKRRWSREVVDYTRHPLRDFSRSSPAISGDRLYIGDSINNLKFIGYSLVNFAGLPGASVIAVNRRTGAQLWRTQVEAHFAARITMSPIVFEDQVIVGVSSQESEIPALKGGTYPCCSFRGSLVSLDAESGKIRWKTRTIDAAVKGVAGAPVWGSSPPIDLKRRRVYIGTGNNYNATPEFTRCYKGELLEARLLNQELDVDVATKKCARLHDSAGNRFDALMAIDVDTGQILWSRKTMVYDAWNVGCGSIISPLARFNEEVCPRPQGIDSDFAQAPMLLTVPINGTPTDILVAGQKSGRFWALRAEDGEVLWTKQVGPGGKLGGHQWGSATDGKTVFFQTTNMEHAKLRLTVGHQRGKEISGGYWGALDAATGRVLWETADPATRWPLKGEGINHLIYGLNLGRGYFAAPMGALTYYNGLVFAGSLSGLMVALDARDGRILWSLQNKGSVVSAPSIIEDRLYWGVGYHMGFAGNEVLSLGL